MKPEASVQRTVIEYCRIVLRAKVERNNAGFAIIPASGNHKRRAIKYGSKGRADLEALLPGGRTLFIECKAPGKKQTPEQKDWQADVERLGHWYVVADDLEAVERFLVGKGYSTRKQFVEVFNGSQLP